MTAFAASKAAVSRSYHKVCKPRANYLNLKATGKPQQAVAQAVVDGVLTCGDP
jgi:hypothetical protein